MIKLTDRMGNTNVHATIYSSV